MPIYDYVCEACGHRWEVYHGLNESGPHQCATCAGGPVKRAFAPPTIVFKGTGWAKMDRRSAAAPRRKSEAAERSADGATKDAERGGGSADSGTASGGEKATEKSARGDTGGSGTGSSEAAPARTGTDGGTGTATGAG